MEKLDTLELQTALSQTFFKVGTKKKPCQLSLQVQVDFQVNY